MADGKIQIRSLKFAFLFSFAAFIVSFSYTVIRQDILKGADFGRVSLYILNESLALTSAILIGSSFLSRDVTRKKAFGLLGLCLALLHAVVSLQLFNLASVLFLFAHAGRLELSPELSVFCGIFAICIFSLVAFIHNKILSYAALLLVALHVCIMGYKSWLKAADWPGHLPPITGLAFVLMAFVLAKGLVYFWRRKAARRARLH